jgi:hypothetical protein
VVPLGDALTLLQEVVKAATQQHYRHAFADTATLMASSPLHHGTAGGLCMGVVAHHPSMQPYNPAGRHDVVVDVVVATMRHQLHVPWAFDGVQLCCIQVLW